MNQAEFILTTPQTEEEFEIYFKFRWQCLREPLGLLLGSERDALELRAYHCAAYLADKTIVGVGRIHRTDEQRAQIRYMATAIAYQRCGVGSSILQKLLDYARLQTISMCWLNARHNAVDFYAKHGFEVIREVDTDLAIPHFLMEKYLN